MSEISIEWTQDDLDMFLADVAVCSAIRSVEINWSPVVPKVSLIAQLRHLDKARIALSMPVADGLPLLRKLHTSQMRNIHLHIEDLEHWEDGLSLDYRRTCLNNSVELELKGNVTKFPLALVLDIFSSKPTEIHMICDFHHPDTSKTSWISCMHVDLLHATLSHSLSTLRLNISCHTDNPFEISSIRPLLQIGCMRHLKFEIDAPWSLSDADVEELAYAWPDIQTLELGLYHDSLQGAGVLPVACPTLRALSSLVQHCPKLGEIYLPLRASRCPSEVPYIPQSKHRSVVCLTLSGGEMRGNEVEDVAFALHRLLPVAQLDIAHAFNGDLWDAVWQEKLRFKLHENGARLSGKHKARVLTGSEIDSSDDDFPEVAQIVGEAQRSSSLSQGEVSSEGEESGAGGTEAEEELDGDELESDMPRASQASKRPKPSPSIAPQKSKTNIARPKGRTSNKSSNTKKSQSSRPRPVPRSRHQPSMVASTLCDELDDDDLYAKEALGDSQEASTAPQKCKLIDTAGSGSPAPSINARYIIFFPQLIDQL
ncbi:uncharacterized protein FIBRA_02810 [Fibroporia radiculosa]|uniref:Uncharacterized protein n=1 Tax=Fibroporia radiculosa TaxID=599839 RepID=J4H222_9APHY|nr:uncharacterized protein FIBRA_02810 [Fibroporia radiculosa]CCM00769.1 predicted protein [Fibroporia radiculosa]